MSNAFDTLRRKAEIGHTRAVITHTNVRRTTGVVAVDNQRGNLTLVWVNRAAQVPELTAVEGERFVTRQ